MDGMGAVKLATFVDSFVFFLLSSPCCMTRWTFGNGKSCYNKYMTLGTSLINRWGSPRTWSSNGVCVVGNSDAEMCWFNSNILLVNQGVI